MLYVSNDNKKNWNKFDGVATDIAKIFNDTFGFKNHHDDYENYQFEINNINTITL
ncbi:MAG: hypothetical protein IPP53_02735 [Bacteroidetes bacterium]|nr:hypothetical protein [Bacteroidota bacterium]